MFGALRTPRNIVFGSGQRSALPRFGSGLGHHALIVTDARLAGEADVLAAVKGLESVGVACSVFGGTIAELPLSCIEEGVEAGRRSGADFVIGFGGGSCIDAAKVIALLLTHGGTPSDYYGEFKVPGPVMPVIAVPTTSGTGSEATPVAVLADPGRATKIGIASPHLIPHTALCDPELTLSCPPALTASSGADALSHAVEAFTNRPAAPGAGLVHDHVFVGKNDLSDHYALMAIRQISSGLARAFRDGSDLAAREALMMGSLSAGIAFGTAGTAAAHAVQYPVGALTHTPHGIGVAVMLPYVMAFNAPDCAGELAAIGTAMGLEAEPTQSVEERAQTAIEAVADLFAAIEIPRTLAELGVRSEGLDDICASALANTRLVKNNRRALDGASMAKLVQAAFTGDRSGLQDPASTIEKA